MKRLLFLFSLCLLPLLTGCGSSSSDGDDAQFRVSGILSDASAMSVTLNGKTITDVIAVCPSTHEQRLGTITGGSFTIDIDPEKPWIIVFADRNRVGVDMIVGKFRAGSLDCLRPSVGSTSTDLGTVTFEAATSTRSASAVASLSFDSLLTAIGMSSTAAEFFGSVDDICLRYINPDINNNGTLDVLEGLTDILLDFHNRYEPRVGGSPVTINYLANAFLPDDVDFHYTQTGVTFELAKSAISLPSAYDFKFSRAATLSDSSTLTADTFYNQSYTDNPLYERYQMGIETIVPPSGTYDVRVGGTTFTFSDVIVPNLSVRNDFLLPFIKFNVRDDNTVSGISYKWMKKTSSGWTQASLAEIDLIVGDEGGHISIYVDGTHQTSDKNIGFSIPKTSVSGTLSMSSAELSNLTSSQAAACVFSRMGHLGVSYDDTLGMRYFAF